MHLLKKVIQDLPDGIVTEVCIGLNWTAVVLEMAGELRCGLASTLSPEHSHGEGHQPSVPQAGELQVYSGLELSEFALSEYPALAGVGVAAINALLPRNPQSWVEANAEQIIAHHGQGKRVAMVGHFPFAGRLRSKVGELLILEQAPEEGDLPDAAAPQVLPEAQVVAITAMTITNHTLEGLLELCSPGALVILIGPTTLLNPLLFDFGVTVLCGAIVTDVEPVLRTISQGGNFRQLHQAGVRLVNMVKPGVDLF